MLGLGRIATAYSANHLNQYTNLSNTAAVDVMGAATAGATVLVNNQPAYRKEEYYWKLLGVGGGSQWCLATNTAVQGGSTTTETGGLYVPPANETLLYDADGNLTNDGRWTFTWDAENRLVRMETLSSAVSAGVPRVRLDFGYDWEGRRQSKTVLTNWTGSAYTITNITRYVYDGWDLLAELNATNKLIRSYVWGLDMGGALETEGNVGGMVEMLDYSTGPPGRHFASYDGNGNVVALVKSDLSISGRYEYGPFGEPIRVTGDAGEENPIRWSTRFRDVETDLTYYGYRYYDARQGRWLGRDPIEEADLVNLYAYVRNNPLTMFDALGMSAGSAADANAGTGGAMAAEGSGGANQAITFLKQIREMVDTFNDIQDIASIAMDMFNAADEVFEALLNSGRQVLAGGPSGRMGRMHHSIPKFMSGNPTQNLIELGGGRHEAFHDILGKHMKAAGLPTGKGGKFNYAEFRAGIGRDRGTRLKAFRALLKATFEFDVNSEERDHL